MEFQQSRTYANLQTAYETELMSSARNLISGDRARQEQYIPIASTFETVSGNNREHARIWLRQINGGTIPTTAEFLLSEAQSDNYIGNELYREFAQVALEEGYTDIASLFNGVANIDLNHSLEFLTYYEELLRGELECKPNEVLWICMQCGNILSGTCSPERCPVCGFPQGYYRVYNPNEPI